MRLLALVDVHLQRGDSLLQRVESNYRENMKRLRNAVKTLLMLAMSSSDEEMPAVGAGRGVDRRLRAR